MLRTTDTQSLDSREAQDLPPGVHTARGAGCKRARSYGRKAKAGVNRRMTRGWKASTSRTGAEPRQKPALNWYPSSVHQRALVVTFEPSLLGAPHALHRMKQIHQKTEKH